MLTTDAGDLQGAQGPGEVNSAADTAHLAAPSVSKTDTRQSLPEQHKGQPVVLFFSTITQWP